MVEAVIVLEVGWQDFQSLAHMPTPPTTALTLLSHVSNLHGGWSVRSSRWSVDSHTGWDPHVERHSVPPRAPVMALLWFVHAASR